MELDSTENLLDLGVELLGSSLQEILLGMLSKLVLTSLIFIDIILLISKIPVVSVVSPVVSISAVVNGIVPFIASVVGSVVAVVTCIVPSIASVVCSVVAVVTCIVPFMASVVGSVVEVVTCIVCCAAVLAVNRMTRGCAGCQLRDPRLSWSIA